MGGRLFEEIEAILFCAGQIGSPDCSDTHKSRKFIEFFIMARVEGFKFFNGFGFDQFLNQEAIIGKWRYAFA